MRAYNFKDKYIWITGASSGIGASLAKQLNEQGAFVIISARRLGKLQDLASQCAYPDKVIQLPLDLTDHMSINKAAGEVKTLGQLDLLIHNAGIAQKGIVAENTMEVDRTIMETNYFGTVALTKEILPLFVKQGYGWFGVVTSFAGVMGVPGRSAYAASKHALHGFFESLKAEHMKCRLKVSFIIPGFINTNITVKGLQGNGQPLGRLEKSHRLGMTAAQCADGIIKKLMKRSNRIVVGKVEVMILRIRRLSPALSAYIIKNNPMKKWRKLISLPRTIVNNIIGGKEARLVRFPEDKLSVQKTHLPQKSA